MRRGWITSVAVLLASLSAADAGAAPTAKAYFAGGCFWCVEADFEKLPGVVAAVSGYTGGKTRNPTYEQVSSGGTGHAEAVEIEYDPAKVSYAALLDHFWKNIDPTVEDQQFCDHGDQYRSAIFYSTPEEKRLAEESRAAIAASGKLGSSRIYTEIEPLDVFYLAEEYHQDYYKKNSLRYRFYRSSCGRDARLEKIWGKAAH
jgi:peptide-methionine (S)-S-oxide reductase